MKKRTISFIILILLLPIVSFYSMTTGSLEIAPMELLRGLLIGGHENVQVIKDFRFPRIIIALFAGATLSVSGVLLQAIVRNPLAEPGIIGISAGAGFFTMLVITFFPTLYFYSPLIGMVGGMLSFLFVFFFSWKSGLNPLRMILIGVAINAIFTGLSEVLSFQGSSLISSLNMSQSSLTMKTWEDVSLIARYGMAGLILAFIFFRYANHLGFKDETLKSLGFPVQRARIILALIAVLLASVATGIAGMFTFVGLIVPHIGRQFVGTNHKYLIPFSALSGALLILIADTIGRTIMAPIEIPASIIMVLIGGPFLIFLLRKSERVYGN